MSQTTIIQWARNPKVFVVFLLIVALALGAVWFLHNFEKKPFEVYRGMSPAARNNPLLAAERYLQTTGQSAESLQDINLFSNLPSPQDAILVRRMPAGLTAVLIDDLLRWIEAGGHLLLVPSPLQTDHPGTGNLLDRLGVRLMEEDDATCGCPKKEEGAETTSQTKQEPVSEEATDSEEEEKDGYHPYDRIAQVRLDDILVRLRLSGAPLLEDTKASADFQVDGTYFKEYRNDADQSRADHSQQVERNGAWLLQYRLGSGTVTVLSETTLFYNSNIGKYDHAFFLSWLLTDANKVWLLHASNMDSLMHILFQQMPLFWVSLATLVCLIVWWLQKRSGMALALETSNRRNILAHIEATGRYNWQLDKGASLVEENRRSLLQWWASRKLGTNTEQAGNTIDHTILAARSGMAEEELHDAFQLVVDSEHHLIRTTRALHKLQTLIHSGETKRHDR